MGNSPPASARQATRLATKRVIGVLPKIVPAFLKAPLQRPSKCAFSGVPARTRDWASHASAGGLRGPFRSRTREQTMKFQQALAMPSPPSQCAAQVLPRTPKPRRRTIRPRTITLVVPFPPGGGNDAMARIMADRLTAGLGKTVVVENRGAGRRHRRHAFGGQGGARRLHADARPHRQHRHQSDALRQRRLRSAQGFHPARTGRPVVARPARASVGAGERRRGPDRARQGQSRQVQFRLVGAGHRLAHVRRDVPARGRRRHESHSLQGHRPAGHRSGRRPRAGVVRGDHAVVRQHQGGQRACARGDEPEALVAVAGRADGVGDRGCPGST